MANSYGFARQIKKGIVPDGYMMTEAGVLPVEWDADKMSNLVKELTQAAGDDIYETVSISAGKGFVNQAQKFGKELSGKQYEKYIVLHKGDFSYNKGNSTVYPQGCIYRLWDRESVAVPNVFESFSIERGDPDYYEQLFISGFLNKQLYSKINRGVRDNGLLNLTGDDFYSCSVPVPPIAEQKRIAEILLQCDKIIELYQCELDEIKKLKKAYLQKLFPQQGSKIPEIRFSGFNNPWEQRKVGELTDVLSASRVHRGDWKAKGIPFFRSSDVVAAFKGIGNERAFISQELYEKLVKSSGRLEQDDILITGGGSIGIPYIVPNNEPLYSKDADLIWIKHSANFDSNFMYAYFTSQVFRDYIRGISHVGTIAHYTIEQVKDTPVAMPSIVEQKTLGAFFCQIDYLITLHLRKLEDMQRMKRALMQLLLTGVIRVST